MNAKKTNPTGRAGKPREKPPKLKGETQLQRFIETVKELGVDESEDSFAKALDAITRPAIQILNKEKKSSKIP